MKKTIVSLFVFAFFLFGDVTTKRLIDAETASSLNRAQMEFGGRIFDRGGLLTQINVGITKEFQIGISYGGTKIIGRDEPDWYKNPGVFAKYIFLEEDYYYPAMAFGFNSQGYGPWLGSRYEIKSKGFFLVASKNWYVAGNLGTLGFHFGVNYCVTEDDRPSDDVATLFLGLDKSIGRDINFITEYDFAFNDNYDGPGARTEGYGYLNLGLKWTFNNTLDIDFMLKDVLRNVKNSKPSREVRLMYKASF